MRKHDAVVFGERMLWRAVNKAPECSPAYVRKKSPAQMFRRALERVYMQEEDQAILVVVDIYGGQVLPMPHSVSKHRKVQQQQQQQQQQQEEQPPLLKVKQCMAHQVDYQLFASRKGLTVQQ
eukprot:scaffold215369_cov19-Tisochrysis_lutea.AAC.2